PAALAALDLSRQARRPAAPRPRPGRAAPPRRPLSLRPVVGNLACRPRRPPRLLSAGGGGDVDLPRRGPLDAGAGVGGRLGGEHGPRRARRLLVAERGDAALAVA